MAANISDILETLAKGRNLSEIQAAEAFGGLVSGEVGPAQAGALLLGLRAKGESPLEVATGVKECLKKANLVSGLDGPRIDTCGTGGDCKSSFNCSTAVALLLASLGHQVVKHGNRSVSSKCGSADVLEGLGFTLSVEPGAVANELAKRNFVFLFAPAFHPAFKHVVPIRKELGIRTVFNIMGPLLNPAQPTHQVLGVGDDSLMELVAGVLALTGVQRAAVVHGAGGYDELTPFGVNRVLYVDNGQVTEDSLDPADYGLHDTREKQVVVGGPEEGVKAMKALLLGKGNEVMAKMAALNLAMGLHLLTGGDFKDCALQAVDAVASGRAAKHFGQVGIG